MTAVGFVGAGQLGEPMVERLLHAGHRVTVFARRPEVQRRLVSAGAAVVETAREAAAGAEVTVVCVFSDEQLDAIAQGVDGLLGGVGEGAVVASHVTGSSATLRALAAGLAERSAHAVDAPVSGTADDVRTGQLTVLLGGEPIVAERVREVVSSYASTVLRIGDLGTALSFKLLNNLLFAAHAQIAVEAVSLAERLGSTPDRFLQALASCSGASYASTKVLEMGGAETFGVGAGPFLRKDVRACLDELALQGVDGGVIAEVIARGPLALTSASS